MWFRVGIEGFVKLDNGFIFLFLLNYFDMCLYNFFYFVGTIYIRYIRIDLFRGMSSGLKFLIFCMIF